MKLHTPSALLGAILVSVLALVTAFAQPQIVIQPTPIGLTQAQKDVLDLLSVVYIDDCQSGPGYKTLRVEGANLQVVNGLGTTDTENGLGNILVGYQESQAIVCDRTGSHNVVGGLGNAYGSYGGLVMGLHNYVDAPRSAILSGTDNHIIGTASEAAIISGETNLVSGSRSVIVTGRFNFIDGNAAIGSGRWAAIVGGGGMGINGNTVEGSSSVVVGGNQHFVDVGAVSAIVVGGTSQNCMSTGSVIVGGFDNTTIGLNSVVSGGSMRTAVGQEDWVAGSLLEDN